MEGWQIHNSFRGGNDRKLLPSRVYAPLRIKIENKNSLERPISIPFLTFSSFSFFFLSFVTMQINSRCQRLENCKKKKDKNCRISRLSLSLSRSKLDLSNLRIYKCGDFDFGYRAVHRFSTVSSVPEIVVHLDNYSSLPIPLPPSSTPSHDTGPIPQTSSSTKPETSIPKTRSIDDRLKDISVPANPFFRSTPRIPFEFSFEWKGGSFQKKGREGGGKKRPRLRSA